MVNHAPTAAVGEPVIPTRHTSVQLLPLRVGRHQRRSALAQHRCQPTDPTCPSQQGYVVRQRVRLCSMDVVSLGQAGLRGWRAKVADVLAGPIARRWNLADDDVRALIGAAFFILSVVYVVSTVRRLVSRT